MRLPNGLKARVVKLPPVSERLEQFQREISKPTLRPDEIDADRKASRRRTYVRS